MNLFKRISLLPCCLILFCCSYEPKVITITEKRIIPEGIAVDDEGSIYLSNINSKNIIKVKNNNSTVLSNKYAGLYEGLGITIVGDTLFALGNRSEDGLNKSVIEIIDSKDGTLIQAIELNQQDASFLNDLVVFERSIYITNTNNHTIYKVHDNALIPFLQSNEIEYPNGITISDDHKTLYIASFTKGIRVYDLVNQTFLNEADTIRQTVGIDGLKFYKNKLYAIQNGFAERRKHALLAYELDNSGQRIIKTDTLLKDHKLFNIPTTLDIKNGHLYCLMNSQLENYVDGKIVNEDILTDTFIYVLKLD